MKNRLAQNSPPKILKEKYNIDLSLADTMINREDLNIVYTSSHMEPTLFQSEGSFVFVGPSLFFKKEQTDFPFDRLKGQKVIYISLGTLHNDNLSFYHTCAKAFAGSEKRKKEKGSDLHIDRFRKSKGVRAYHQNIHMQSGGGFSRVSG